MSMVAGKGFVQTQPLYDTIELGIGAVVGSFFSIPYNGILTAAILKTWRDTNLVQAGRLELGHEMSVNGISLHLPSTDDAGAFPTAPDIRAIHAGNIRWIMGGSTEVLKIPVALIPNAGAELVLFSNITPAATEWHLINGASIHQNRFMLDEPYTIRSQESIEIVIENMDAIAAATWITIVLWGTSVRPVR